METVRRNFSDRARKTMSIDSLFDLTGKTAVVTGAGSGLGRAMAEAIAEAGARVACVDVNGRTARETAEQIRKPNVESIYLECDVSKEDEVGRTFESVEREFGRLDILFNNAGISGANVSIRETSLEEWNRVLGINLTGMFLCARATIKLMIKWKSGKIINTSSICGFRGGYPLLMVPPYHAAKGAIISLTREMALECAKDRINVNAIIPGFFATNIASRSKDEEFHAMLAPSIPLGRVGMPEDLKGTALFLASAASDYLTGALIPVDGGYLCK
jgi:NAD(P)-dependent dehydrogenase (short-subunit alcohol dehydrogenase family)